MGQGGQARGESMWGREVTGWKRAIQGFRSTDAEANKPAEINHAVDLLFEVQVGISSKLMEIQA